MSVALKDVWIYGPVGVMAKYRDLLVRDDDDDTLPILIADATCIEAAGVVGRRAAICHAFPVRHLLRLRKLLIQNGDYGAPTGIDSADELPANWRYPTVIGR